MKNLVAWGGIEPPTRGFSIGIRVLSALASTRNYQQNQALRTHSTAVKRSSAHSTPDAIARTLPETPACQGRLGHSVASTSVCRSPRCRRHQGATGSRCLPKRLCAGRGRIEASITWEDYLLYGIPRDEASTIQVEARAVSHCAAQRTPHPAERAGGVYLGLEPAGKSLGSRMKVYFARLRGGKLYSTVSVAS